ncbi:MAG: hypothetical protein ABI634_13245 [Acidobacteriota bacterium]
MMKRFQPSLIGGLFIGILSALPIVGAANACCCLWVVVGGVLTVYLQKQAHPDSLEVTDAILGGLVAGAIGALVHVLANAVLFSFASDRVVDQIRNAFDQNPQLPPEIRDRMDDLLSRPNASALMAVAFAAISLPIYAIFSMLGALLGFAMFRNPKKPETPV